ncbi:MAG: hypothetical protein M1829_005850 [Trizodia sp. TS-e1964]|nr:MAG: hypothetical protein M1829_005850 [Trizodia sp. TS-e1964]
MLIGTACPTPTTAGLRPRSEADFFSRGGYGHSSQQQPSADKEARPSPPPPPKEDSRPKAKQELIDIGFNTDPTTGGISLPDPFRNQYGPRWNDKLWGVVKIYAQLPPSALPASLAPTPTAGLFLWPIDVTLGLSGYLLHVVAQPWPGRATASTISFEHQGLGELAYWRNPRRALYVPGQTLLRTQVHLFDLFPEGVQSVRRARLVGDLKTSEVGAFAALAMEEEVRGSGVDGASAWVDGVVRSAKAQGLLRHGPSQSLRELWGGVEKFMRAGEEWNLRAGGEG